MRDDRLWIVDRKKVDLCSLMSKLGDAYDIQELIKVKGFQVAPAELEAVLLENKDVEDAAVVGVSLLVS